MNNEEQTNSELHLDAKDLQSLAKKGIAADDIAELTAEVNEQLSDNANDNANDDTDDDTDDGDVNNNAIKDDDNANDHNSPSNQKQPLDDTHNLTKSDKLKQEKKLDALKTHLAQKQNSQKIDYKAVRLTIEAGALPSAIYYVMNGLSAVIAGFGLLLNSPAVVIGAMLVAMLLGPITGLALALIDYRFSLVKQSLLTLVSGAVLIYCIGLVLGFLYPEHSMTAEIIGRTSPNTMDLMIALAGGTAGAYAMISPKLSVAVVGVAVATALVPPLTASAILLANGQYQLSLGAFLLALTNILAIQLTNALVLWWAGFRRLGIDEEQPSQSKWAQLLLFAKRNAITLILLAIIGSYLSMNFNQSLKQQNFEKSVNKIINTHIQDKPLYLVNTSFEKSNLNIGTHSPYLIYALIQGQTLLTHEDVKQMEIAIAQSTATKALLNDKPIKLQIRFVPEQVIQSTPIAKDDIKLDKSKLAQTQSSP